MKRIIGTCLMAISTSAFAQVLTFEKTTYDFGGIDNVKPVTQDVTFKNTGDATLNIENVKTSCGCTASKVEKSVLEPGEDSFVTVTFNPAGKAGKVRKSITFFSNDSVTKTKTIFITANITPIWDYTPKRIEFKLGPTGYEKTTQELIIKNSGKEVLSILGVSCNNEQVTIEGSEKADIDPGGTEEYQVSINPEFKPARSKYMRINIKSKIGEQHISRTLSVYVRTPRPKGGPTNITRPNRSGSGTKRATNPAGSGTKKVTAAAGSADQINKDGSVDKKTEAGTETTEKPENTGGSGTKN